MIHTPGTVKGSGMKQYEEFSASDEQMKGRHLPKLLKWMGMDTGSYESAVLGVKKTLAPQEYADLAKAFSESAEFKIDVDVHGAPGGATVSAKNKKSGKGVKQATASGQ
jgi:hypothetical protein